MAGYEVIEMLSSTLYGLVGNPLIFTTIILSIMVFILVMFKAPLSVILSILIPVIIGIVLNTVYNNMLELPAWIVPFTFILFGFLFAGFFLYLISR